MRTYIAVMFVVMVFGHRSAMAQGCSDAGFCTAGAMQSGHSVIDSIIHKMNNIGLSLTAGAGENGTTIITPQLEGKIGVGKYGYIEGKLPYNIASGSKGSHAGIGDLIITYTHPIFSNSKWQMNGTMGTRISLGDAAAADNNKPLPMPYQSNLGTTDIIAGISALYGRYINLAVGYQQPVILYNMNDYEPMTIYPVTQNNNEYFASRRLQRKADVLLRVEGILHWKQFVISAGPLLIYHLGRDKITTIVGSDTELTGSEGLTLNLAGTISYSFKKNKLDLLAGTPFIVRDYRPDGLTRAWVITLRYSHSF